MPDRRHSFWVKNFSRSLTIDAVSPQRQRDWIQSIVRATGKDTPGNDLINSLIKYLPSVYIFIGFDFIRRNRFGSFAPPRENSRAYHFVDGEVTLIQIIWSIKQQQKRLAKVLKIITFSEAHILFPPKKVHSSMMS